MIELMNIPRCNSRSSKLGIAGPDLVLAFVSVLMLLGRDGPTISSSLLASALAFVFIDRSRSLRSAAALDGESPEAEAFCNVAGSYHPSASSPRFLRDVSSGVHMHGHQKTPSSNYSYRICAVTPRDSL